VTEWATLEWLLEIILSFWRHIQEIVLYRTVHSTLSVTFKMVKSGQTNFIHILFTEHKYTSICTHTFHQALSMKVHRGRNGFGEEIHNTVFVASSINQYFL